MIPVTLTATLNGKPLAGASLTAGQTVTVDIMPSGPIDGLNLADITGPKIVTLGYDSKPPYSVTFVVPKGNGKGVASLQIEARKSGEQAGKIQADVKIQAAGGNVPASLPAVLWGSSTNDADANAAAVGLIAQLVASGAKLLRLWHSNFGKINDKTTALINAAHEAGLKVYLVVQPKDGEAYDLGSPDFAGFVSKNAAVLQKVAFVEAGNELNLVKYRPNDLGGGTSWYVPYVQRWLKPLRQALAAYNVGVLATSVTDSEHPENYAVHAKGLADAGVAAWCSGAAVHAYVYLDSKPNVFTVSQLGSVMSDYYAKIGVPVHLTELNFHDKVGAGADFETGVPTLLRQARTARGMAGVIWYRGCPSNNPSNNTGGRPLVDVTGKPTALLATVKKALTV